MDVPAKDPLALPGVYAITNTLDGATYIGSTSRACGMRWAAHKNNLIKQRHINTLLQEAFNTFGMEAFTFAILETCNSKEALAESEKLWFTLFKKQHIPLYNLAPIRRGHTYSYRVPKPRLMRICLYCGKSFPSYPCQRGLYCCHQHYIAHTKRPISERFWELVDKSLGQHGCWPWKGPINDHGYGRFSICIDGKPKWELAHRVSFELVKGPILPGFFICHSCDVHHCCQPEHLLPGTASDNIADAVSKGRMAHGANASVNRYPEKVQRGNQHWTKRMPDLIPHGDNHYMKRLPNARKRLQGEQNHMAKFTDALALEAYKLKWTITLKQAANIYHVSITTISLLWNKKIYCHIHKPI